LGCPCFQPHARSVALFLEGHWQALQKVHPAGLFVIAAADIPEMYRLKADFDHASREFFDPYAFIPHLPPFDLYLFNEGRLLQAYDLLGANVVTEKGLTGPALRFGLPTRKEYLSSVISMLGTAEFMPCVRWEIRVFGACLFLSFSRATFINLRSATVLAEKFS